MTGLQIRWKKVVKNMLPLSFLSVFLRIEASCLYEQIYHFETFLCGYIKRTKRPIFRLNYSLLGLLLPQCRWIDNYYFITHESWILMHKVF